MSCYNASRCIGLYLVSPDTQVQVWENLSCWSVSSVLSSCVSRAAGAYCWLGVILMFVLQMEDISMQRSACLVLISFSRLPFLHVTHSGGGGMYFSYHAVKGLL